MYRIFNPAKSKNNISFAPGNYHSMKVTTHQKKIVVNRKTERQTDRTTDRQKDRQTERQTDKVSYRGASLLKKDPQP